MRNVNLGENNDFYAADAFCAVAQTPKKEARGKCKPKPASQQQRKRARPFLPPSHAQGQL